MTQSTADVRPLLHEMANEFGVLYGTAELFAVSPGLSEQQRHDANVMLDALRRLAELLASDGAEANPYRLTAELAHELRTPLQAVIGFAEMLQAGEARDDCLRGVVTAGRHMAGLLDDAIVGRAGQTRTSVGAAVAQAVLLASPLARAADVRLVAIRRTAQDLVGADPLRLRQAVLNLLTNAVACSRPEGEVNVVVSRRAGTVTIACHDCGPGLTADEITELLNLRRGDRAHGLGLVITRELVGGMGGALGIRSVPGRGSCFSIDLPALSQGRD
ncbi:HAMP domain-containing sensor histidine kinase [Streptomyces sp. NPDC047043]|uniref:sensor histidine kinase n=1 Tax=Streptomyces sp. NPDC047043 TaxID=3154497 RepID=UPI0033C8AE86